MGKLKALDENLNLGSKPDWYGTNFPAIRDFSENFYKTFLNYDNYNHRHSPVYLIFLSFFSRAGIDFDIIRFLHLNISIILIFLFFKCLSIKFKSADKNILFLLVLKIAKKTPTNIPNNNDNEVNSIVSFVAFNNLGKCSEMKSKSI